MDLDITRLAKPQSKIHFPPALIPGDRIAFLSPASAVKDEYVATAMERFRERGYEPVLMPHALGPRNGSYSSSKINRLDDFIEALKDDTIRGILCNRGGYGCVHLLPDLHDAINTQSSKWLIGFSDVSALLAMSYMANIASIHGPMAKHLATQPPDDYSTKALFNILENGGKFNYRVNSSPDNIYGKVTGILRGGNLAVLNGLAATPYDILEVKPHEEVILFFEDINEPIYAIERILWRLSLSGSLNRVKGLIFGQFTDYKPDRNFNSMEEMIHRMLQTMAIPEIPVVFNFPIGHVTLNLPLTVGATTELTVEKDFTYIKTLD